MAREIGKWDGVRRVAPLRGVAAVDEVAASVADFDALFRRYARYVAAIGLRLLGRADEVDDLVQEVFVEVLRNFERMRDPDAIKGWIATVAVRLARRRLRRRRFWQAFGVGGAAAQIDRIASDCADPEQCTLLGRVYVALDALPVDQRIAWTLRHLEGERLDTVARLCDCSLATAKRRIAAAHEAIERIVGDG